MRAPGLFNWALAVGLAIGPAIGAFLYALIAGIWNASLEFFGFFFAWIVVPGYLTGLPLFAIALITLRNWRIDWLGVCALLGFLIGLLDNYLLMGADLSPDNWLSVALFSGFPFAVMFGFVRLIAGPRT